MRDQTQSIYTVGRADPDDNRNARWWAARQAFLTDLARGIPTLAKFLGGLTVTGATVLPLGTVANVLLDYTAAVDLAVATATVANTYLNIGPNNAFTVLRTGSTILVAVTGCINCGASAALALAGGRILIDSGGTPQARQLSGGAINATVYANCGMGLGRFGLAAGAHTVQIQVVTAAAATANCRPATQGLFEGLNVIVYELDA